MVYPTGFEPAAFGVGVQRSIQLSYGYIADTLYYAQKGKSTTAKARERTKNFGAGLDLAGIHGIIKFGK